MSLLHVARPGLFTTIQDRGRWGYQAWGVPVSGPMDAWSARLANRLVEADRRDLAVDEADRTNLDLGLGRGAERRLRARRGARLLASPPT